MPFIHVKIVGGNSFEIYDKINPEKSVNFVKSNNALISFMGYKAQLTAFIQGESRGIYTSNVLKRMIIVIGNKVYKANIPVIEEIGTLDSTEGFISFAENFNNEIAISDYQNYYIYNYNLNTFVKKTPSDIGFIPGDLTFDDQKGYIFAAVKASNTFRYTEPNTALTFDPFNVGQIGNDVIVGIENFGSSLFVLGSTRTQIWRDTGSAFTPYQKDGSTIILMGALSKDSVCVGFGLMAWVATSPVGNISLVVSDGSGVRPVIANNQKLQFILSDLKYPNSAYGAIFQEYGTIFYQVTFFEDKRTFLIDLKAQEYYDLTDEFYSYHILKFLTFFDNKYYFLSFRNNIVYHLSADFNTYDGKIVPRTRIPSMINSSDGKLMMASQYQIFMQQGNSSGNPFVEISLSKDGGASYGNVVTNDLPQLGKSRDYFRINNLGMFQEMAIRMVFFCDGKIVILGSQLMVR